MKIVASMIAASSLISLSVTDHEVPKISKAAKAEIVKTNQKLILDKKNFDCLVKNVYHEAGVESLTGKVAVAQVTLNRLKTQRWGKSICSVVYAKAQFSWTLSSKLKFSKPKGQLWNDSVAAVHAVINGSRVRNLDYSLWYHADYIRRPKWTKVVKQVQVVDKHIFYV